MALNHVAEQNSGKSGQNRQIFTFFVEDMMFGLDVENVLMLGQEVNEIQRLPIEERGFCGVVKFQGAVVPVLDYAHRIGVPSGVDCKSALLEQFIKYEKNHTEWVNSLEESIRNGTMFTKETNPALCEFGKWYSSFKTRDETLQELMEAFKEPHQIIHGLAETLLALRDNDQKEEALALLNNERERSLHRLGTLFSRARDHVEGAMRQVLLFVTLDGKTPRYALLIDEINDVMNYTAADFQSSRSGALGLFRKIEDVVEGIFTRKDTPDCLFFDINKMTDSEEEMKKVS